MNNVFIFNNYGRALLSAPPQAIASNPHTNLLNVYIQLANKIGFQQQQNLGYFVIRLYNTHIKCIITLLSQHVSALLGHHHVTNVYNYDIKDIPIE
jgi:hypothetical protein